MTTPHTHTPTPAAERADRRQRYASMTAAEIVAAMSADELEHNARRGAPMAIAEQERRQAQAAEDAAPVPLWQQARKAEIERINSANEYDIGSIRNYDPDL